MIFKRMRHGSFQILMAYILVNNVILPVQYTPGGSISDLKKKRSLGQSTNPASSSIITYCSRTSHLSSTGIYQLCRGQQHNIMPCQVKLKLFRYHFVCVMVHAGFTFVTGGGWGVHCFVVSGKTSYTNLHRISCDYWLCAPPPPVWR